MARRMCKFFSILMVVCLLISMLPAAVFAATPSKLYLKPNSNWTVDSARFGAYFFVGDSYTWASMSSYGGGYYVCSVPSGGYTSVIFCRMDPGNSANDWGAVWNQTNDLTIPTNGNNCYTVSDGAWSYGDGSWSTFSCPHSWSSGKCSYCGTSCSHSSHNTSAVCTTCGSSVSHSYNSGSVTKAATCTTTGTKTYTCTVCGGTKTETIAKLGHNYTSKVTAATCTAQGYTTYTCSRCSDSYKSNYTNATGHSYTSKVTKAATCTTAGVRTYTCSKCSNSYTESIAATGHSYKNTVTSPTCTAQGYTTHTCSTCGYSYKDTYTAATGHSYKSTVTAPTCTTGGYTTYTCSKCSDTYTGNATSATGHSYTSKVTKAATCTADGVRTYTCSGCSASYTEAITKLGHSYKSTVTAPTCTAGGYTTHTCATCGNSYTDSETAATGHSWYGASCATCGTAREYYLFGYINGANYACEEDGDNLGSYKFSGGKLTVTFDSTSYVAVKTGDNASWYMTNGYPGDFVTSATLYNVNAGIDANKLYVPGGVEVTFTITANGANDTVALSYTINASTCTHQRHGIDGKCSACGASVSHSWSDGTCTHCGAVCGHSWSSGKCSICGISCSHSYSGESCTICGSTRDYYLFGFISGEDHGDGEAASSYKFTNKKLTVTFTEDSYVAIKTSDLTFYMTNGYVTTTSGTFYNTNNGISSPDKMLIPGGAEVTLTLTINASNDTLTLSYTVNASTCVHLKHGTDGKCTTCGATVSHSWSSGTCTHCGKVCSHSWSSGKCSVCGIACSHSYDSGKVTTAATCTTAGVKTYTCTTCGSTKTESIAATGHSYKSTVTAPTCTAQGYTTYTCSACGHSYTGNTTAATGHSYDNGVITKQPTCTTAGVKTYTCGSCGATYTESVAATGHSYQSTVTKPTCTAEGYTTYTCSCGYSYTGSTVAATGHSYDSGVITTQPGCESTGVKTYTCGSCGSTKTETVAATGHSYTTQVIAPTCTEAGYTLHTCACGHSYTDTETPATGHSWVDGICGVCGEVCEHSWQGDTCTICGKRQSYYLFGFINGGNYACEEDYENLGEYKFADGSLTATFTEDSYVAVKTGDNLSWYMTDGWLGNVNSAILYNTNVGIDANKLFVPGGVAVTFTLTQGDDDTLNLSYTIDTSTCVHLKHDTNGLCTVCGVDVGHSWEGDTCTGCGKVQGYFLFGYINGANYACEEDAENLGEFKFVDGSLTATFACDSYVAVKTGDNLSWYMTNGWLGEVSSATLYNTSVGIDANKLFVPGGVEVTFVLVVNTDDTLSLSYTLDTATCVHLKHGQDGKCTVCGVAVSHSWSEGVCTGCALVCTHSWSNGACAVCGTVCDHSYDEGSITTQPDCENDGVKTFTCSICAHSYTESVAALGHSYTAVTTAPTCTDFGYTTYTCSCGDSYVDDQVPALGHSYDEGSITTQPGCTTEGVKTFTCSVCGSSYAEVVAATGHSYTDQVVAPTCTESGYTIHTCACGDSYTDGETPATGHSYQGDTCTVCGLTRSYYLFGYINGANYGCEEDAENIGQYQFVDGSLTVTFDSGSFVAVKTGDNLNWYMTDGWLEGVTSATLYNNEIGIDANKLSVPGGVEITFTLVVNDDDTLTLSYTANTETCIHLNHGTDGNCTVCAAAVEHVWVDGKCACGAECAHSFTGNLCDTCGFERSYYLFGFINGADYAYADDGHNLGIYKFVDGQLVITLESDSYVGVKNNLGAWYMSESYITAKTGTFLNTDTGVSEKMLLPGGVELTLSLTVNEDDTLTLTYVVNPETCPHASHDQTGICLLCEAAVEHSWEDSTCTACGAVCEHSWESGTCTVCGAVCEHAWENGICTGCGMACTHSWEDSTCTICGLVCTHSYENGTCTVCGVVCEHSWEDGVCTICTMACTHSYEDGTCTICGKTGLTQDYYIFGWINGGNYACEENGSELGIYKFDENGQITLTFDQNSYIGVKTGDNANWYMTDGYLGEVTTATLYNTSSGISADKFFIPGGVEVTITIVVNDDDTLTISYTGDLCDHPGHGTDGLCTACGQYIGHSWSNSTCTECGAVCSHSWDNGTCTNCGKVCSHSWSNGTCTICGNGCWHNFSGATCTNCGYTKTYYLFGYINGANYACEEDGANLGSYKFVNGKLTVKFTSDSYIGVKTGDNYSWYMTDGYLGEVTSATLYKTDSGISAEKLFVPGGVYVTFTLTVNSNDTLSISYVAETCYHSYHNSDGNCTYCGKWVGHNWSGTYCSGCGKTRNYYIFGYINGANYACEEDGGNLGSYKFSNNQITVHFDSDSYIGVKNDDGGWYMTDGYLGNVTSATLYNTSAGISAEKLFIPGGCDVTIYITINSNDTISIRYVADICTHPSHNTSGNCTSCGASVGHNYSGDTCTVCGAKKAYYLFGYINGANYACEEDGSNLGSYKFENGKLIVTFDTDSYVGVKTGDNASWYMTDGYLGQVTSATLYNTSAGINADKLFVPGGVEVIFTLTVNTNDTLTLSYTTDACQHPSHDQNGICSGCGITVLHSFENGACTVCGAATTYYLFGYINGANYGCEDDQSNLGIYKFVDGKLVATFESDSYIGIKTGDNASWFMTESYVTDTTATFLNTSTGASEKMLVPGGVELTFTLTVNEDGTLTLRYTDNNCAHTSHGTDGLCADCGETVAHSYTAGICDVCGKSAIDLSHATLSIENEVFYNIYFKLDDATLTIEEMGLLLFAESMDEGTMDDATTVIPGFLMDGSLYAVKTNGIAAKNLGDMVYFKVYAKLSDGTCIYSKVAFYSTEIYAKNILTNSADEQMKALVVALLNYGAAAQSYFSYNTDALVNAFLTEEQMALVEAYRADMMMGIVGVDSGKVGPFAKTEGGFLKNYPTVSCEGTFAINYHFIPAHSVDGDITFYYWTLTDYLAADVLSPENASGSMIMVPGEVEGEYVAEYANIPAKHVDQTLYVAGIYESEGVTYATGVLPYSLGAYCTGSAVNSTNPAMAAVGQSVVTYGYYAKSYFCVLSYGESYVLADGTVLNPGQSKPATPTDGDMYVVDGYTYKYGWILDLVTDEEGVTTLQWVDAELEGWSVMVNDPTQTEYAPILNEISGASILSLRYTFYGCAAMTQAPEIPATVTDLTGTFSGCTALEQAPEIPGAVTNLTGTFSGCTALTGTITLNVQLPEVADCEDGCALCAGDETLTCENCTVCGSYAGCFAGTTQPIELSGECAVLDALAATAENGNVTVAEPEVEEPPVEDEVVTE